MLRPNSTDPGYITIGEENGDDLTKLAEDGNVTLDEEQWDKIAVLPRGRTLYDVTKFFQEAPGRKKKPNLLKQFTLHKDVLLHQGIRQALC